MIRVVLDPEVLVAAAIAPTGICAQLLEAVLDERYEFVSCPILLLELEDVLLRSKFRRYLSEARARYYVMLVAGVSVTYPDPVVQVGLIPDPDDDYLIALAHQAKVDHLISGDAHLTNLPGSGVSVLSPGGFLDSIKIELTRDP